MIESSQQGTTTSIDEAVEAYESTRDRDGKADLEAFLPARSDPLYLAILCELVRVDLEYSYQEAKPNRLDDYERRFPDLFRDTKWVKEITYEEYRLRQQAGESPSVAEYRGRYGLYAFDWPAANLGIESEEAPEADSSFFNPTGGMTHAALIYQTYRDDAATDLGSHFMSSGASREQAEMFESIHEADPAAASRFAKGLTAFPNVGGRFLGFRLRSELGQGAFGRVFLAEQEAMAGRRVVLKITPDAGTEVNALAQLQHTNVVPIYSVHRHGPLQALCMPYFGSTTLADVIAGLNDGRTLPDSGKSLLNTLDERKSRLSEAISDVGDTATNTDSSSFASKGKPTAPEAARATAQIERIGQSKYVDAILLMGVALADGLAHSHERGILHRDLKPANILFADDGVPMLLDFNLAASSKTQGSASTALVGGTLPYMALEHLQAFQGKPRPIDARSDLFSLGVILFQLLSGRHPYEVRRGPINDVIAQMIEDRKGPVPSLWTPNRSGSAAVDAIVGKLLDPEPGNRYQSARELQVDLQRHLDNLPLQHAKEPYSRERLGKWAKRHPRLTSITSVATASALLIVGLIVSLNARQTRIARLEAVDSLVQLTSMVKEAEFLLSAPEAPPQQLDEGIALCRRGVDAYGVRTDPSWLNRSTISALSEADRVQARQGVGELLSLWARGLSWRIKGSENQREEKAREAERLVSLAETAYGTANVPRILRLQSADLAQIAGRDAEASRLRAEAEKIPLRTARERLLLVPTLLDRGLNRQAYALSEEASRLEPLDFSVWMLRGHCLARLSQNERADQSYSIGMDLQPGLDWAHLDRGILALNRRDYGRAIADFNAILEVNPDQMEALLNRTLAKLGQGDFPGAVADLDRVLKNPEAPTRTYFIRARAHAALGRMAEAEADRLEGQTRLPSDELSWVTRGLSRLPADPAGALADFQEARKLNPRSLWSLQNEANVLSESLGRAEDAIKSLDQAIHYHPESVPALTGRAVLLARLGRREAAHKDAAESLALDDSADTLYRAACAFALTSFQVRSDSDEALRLISLAVRKDSAWLGQLDTDPDLAPLRHLPEFLKLREALKVVCSSKVLPN